MAPHRREQVFVPADAASEHDEREVQGRCEWQDVERDAAGCFLDDRDRDHVALAGGSEQFSRLERWLEDGLLVGRQLLGVLGDGRCAGVDIVEPAVADGIELARCSVAATVQLPAEHDGRT